MWCQISLALVLLQALAFTKHNYDRAPKTSFWVLKRREKAWGWKQMSLWHNKVDVNWLFVMKQYEQHVSPGYFAYKKRKKTTSEPLLIGSNPLYQAIIWWLWYYNISKGTVYKFGDGVHVGLGGDGVLFGHYCWSQQYGIEIGVCIPIPSAKTLTSTSEAASQVVKHPHCTTMFEVSVTTF